MKKKYINSFIMEFYDFFLPKKNLSYQFISHNSVFFQLFSSDIIKL